MTWDSFIYFSLGSVFLWVISDIIAYTSRKKTIPVLFRIAGLLLFSIFIAGLWASLERPPLRTMGETRLWYSFFLPLAGLLTYLRWDYKWILPSTTLLSLVFIIVNIANPDIHNKVLMPALQSPWFAPHVIIYMFSYALLGAGTLIAVYYLVKEKQISNTNRIINMTDNIVYAGFVYYIRYAMGAIWARHGVITGAGILKKHGRSNLAWICIYTLPTQKEVIQQDINDNFDHCFVLLQICWYGVNRLPSAQQSIHTYS